MIGHRRGLEHLTVSLRRSASARLSRLRMPKVRVRRLPYQCYRRVVRKRAMFIDPVKRELLPWAWPKHPKLR